MEKNIYIKPEIKIQAIKTESGVLTLSILDKEAEGDALAREFNFGNEDSLEEDEDIWNKEPWTDFFWSKDEMLPVAASI